jgi:Flp pilus assembly protein TadG
MMVMLKALVGVGLVFVAGCSAAVLEDRSVDAGAVDAGSRPLPPTDAGIDVADAADAADAEVDPNARVMTANCNGGARLGVCWSASWDARVPFMAQYGFETSCQTTPFTVGSGITTWRESGQAGCVDVGFPLSRCCPE